MYIPAPIIMAANAANGTRRKILVLRPIIDLRSMPIKLSQCQLTAMLRMPFVFGSCSNETISLGSRSDALSHLTAKVLGHVKSLFLITMSSLWERVRSGWPFPQMINSWSPARIEIDTLASEFLSLSFSSWGRSSQLEFAFTPTMQSPRGVRWDSFVISNVVLWFDLMFSCPENSISKFTDSR